MTLPNVDAIGEAVRAEEQSAAMALRAATNKAELVSVWWRDCDHHTGAARERLQAVYAERLTRFAPMARSG